MPPAVADQPGGLGRVERVGRRVRARLRRAGPSAASPVSSAAATSSAICVGSGRRSMRWRNTRLQPRRQRDRLGQRRARRRAARRTGAPGSSSKRERIAVRPRPAGARGRSAQRSPPSLGEDRRGGGRVEPAEGSSGSPGASKRRTLALARAEHHRDAVGARAGGRRTRARPPTGGRATARRRSGTAPAAPRRRRRAGRAPRPRRGSDQAPVDGASPSAPASAAA